MFKKIRIALLLTVLFFIGVNAWLTQVRSTDWNAPLSVSVHPVSGDNSNKIEWYLNKLSVEDFNGIETYMAEQASQYGVALNPPVYFRLGTPLDELPPALPQNIGTLGAMVWSLKFRYWAWRMKKASGETGSDIHLFIVYHDPDKVPSLQHSVGLQKGMIGIVNAYGDKRYNGSNRVVILHELLHTLGATDKYNLSTGKPLYPGGYAEPDKTPLYPQRYAEIMGGLIPKTETETKMPKKLGLVRINHTTAAEIGWLAINEH